MKKLFALILVVAMVASLASLAGCSNSGATADNADTGKTYVIYSDTAFPPFEYLDEASGEYVGIDMDLMAAIAEDQGFKYEMHNEGFDASMGAVQSGQADAMIAGMTVTDERRETYDFSDAYFEDGTVLVVPKDSGLNLEGLKGKSVAAKTSTVGGEYAESIKDQYGFTVNYYESSDLMYQAVSSGADAACMEDLSVVTYAIKTEKLDLEVVTEPVNVCPYGFAVKKGSNPELIEMFNKGLANLIASGKFDEIKAKYGF